MSFEQLIFSLIEKFLEKNPAITVQALYVYAQGAEEFIVYFDT